MMTVFVLQPYQESTGTISAAWASMLPTTVFQPQLRKRQLRKLAHQEAPNAEAAYEEAPHAEAAYEEAPEVATSFIAPAWYNTATA